MNLSRRQLAVATVGALAGCASSAGEEAPAAEEETATRREDTDGAAAGGTAGGDGSPGNPSFPVRSRALPLPMSGADLRSAARSGGPPKDGIPAIDAPSFVAGDDATFMNPNDVVFGIERDGAVKAYPQKILVHHEICNDTVAGTPLAVTYCPLTGTVLGFRRDGTTFGVSGRLVNNNLIMYDRASETWWPQVLATSIPGPWNPNPGQRSLQEVRLIWTTWKAWREEHPETRVLSTDTGYARNYGADPYGSYGPPAGYYAQERTLFPVLNEDDRFHKKAVVMGARTPEGAVAAQKSTLQREKLLEGSLTGTPILAVYDPRYETGYVYENPDGQSFEYDAGTVVTPADERVAPEELPLDRIHTFDAMWFAWHGFYPETDVLG
jgi:hypothetical protein